MDGTGSEKATLWAEGIGDVVSRKPFDRLWGRGPDLPRSESSSGRLLSEQQTPVVLQIRNLLSYGYPWKPRKNKTIVEILTFCKVRILKVKSFSEQAVREYMGVKVQLHSLLTAPLQEDQWFAWHLAALFPGKHSPLQYIHTEGSVGPWAALDVPEKRKLFWSSWESNYASFFVHLVA
jgi:hypothetical protein